MRYYKPQKQYQYFCGIDLHTKTMYLCVQDEAGHVQLHKNIRSRPGAFLKAVEPYRQSLVVACECVFCWYWLADLCRTEAIEFVLGHALYMKAIHGGKTKNDRVDAEKIAMLLRGGLLPEAYAYPSEWRATRDLLRRRSRLVRMRAELLGHVQLTRYQYNLPAFRKKLAYRAGRHDVGSNFEDAVVRRNVGVDIDAIDYLERAIKSLEAYLVQQTTVHDLQTFHRLRTVPGIGQVLAMTLLYEIEDIRRFPRVQGFVSYARHVKGQLCREEARYIRRKDGKPSPEVGFFGGGYPFPAREREGQALRGPFGSQTRQGEGPLDSISQTGKSHLFHDAKAGSLRRGSSLPDVYTSGRIRDGAGELTASLRHRGLTPPAVRPPLDPRVPTIGLLRSTSIDSP